MLVFAVAALLACPSLTYAQETSVDMTMAELSANMDKLGGQMDELGKMMDMHDEEMEKYGKEWEKDITHPNTEARDKMVELGEKMSELGEKMGKLGEQMGQYGEKMGALHRDMNDWFFRELKKDGLLASFKGKVRVIFDDKGLDVNGSKASEAQFQKYKTGFEKFWGRSLKADFLYFFNGTLEEKDGKIDPNGSVNMDF